MNTKVATLRRWRILSAFLISEMRMALKLIDVVPDVNGLLVPAMSRPRIRDLTRQNFNGPTSRFPARSIRD
jgi:hypothetical protein